MWIWGRCVLDSSGNTGISRFQYPRGRDHVWQWIGYILLCGTWIRNPGNAQNIHATMSYPRCLSYGLFYGEFQWRSMYVLLLNKKMWSVKTKVFSGVFLFFIFTMSSNFLTLSIFVLISFVGLQFVRFYVNVVDFLSVRDNAWKRFKKYYSFRS